MTEKKPTLEYGKQPAVRNRFGQIIEILALTCTGLVALLIAAWIARLAIYGVGVR